MCFIQLHSTIKPQERDVASYLFSVHVLYPTMSVDII